MLNNSSQVINSVEFMLFLMILILTLVNTKSASAVSDLPLPKEICTEVKKSVDNSIFSIDDCSEFTETSTNAQYIDLNEDGTKELIFVYGGGSCGSGYWVFKLNEKLKWVSIGAWCGCDDGIFKVKNTKHNGYFDIWTCGFSGLFDGKQYNGIRQ